MPLRFRGMRSARRGLPGRVKLVLFLVILIVIYAVSQSRLNALAAKMAESRAKNIGQTAINLAIEEEMQREQISYDDLVMLEKGDNGIVTALKSNIVESNRIKSLITQNILKRLTEIPESELSIPIGNLINSQLFSNRGPRIPVSIRPLGSVAATFRHNFSSAGINQTRHQIVFDATVNITVILPSEAVSVQITSEVTVAETIIVGNVPGSYTFFDVAGADSETLVDMAS